MQVREEADAVAARCGADLRVSALAADTPAAQRDALLHAGQLVVATPGQVAQVRPCRKSHFPSMPCCMLGQLVVSRRGRSRRCGLALNPIRP